ncbi:PfkB family carbohydrate kinase [Cellulomonas sp. NTE-D12]|uniref:carbohydrate kinase family protein n=1 Tax=Cellulomonas sp. NTE-D12 TaxID=2962632 RepID=UPI003081771D|nr:ribokinase [Cellulomonas sp. NTE-D12]
MPNGVDVDVLGECVADTIRYSAQHEVTYPGGSAANVAVGLARLGRRVDFATCLGDDEHGQLMRAHLAREHVYVTNVAAEGTPTPSAVAVLDESGAAAYEFSVTWAEGPNLPAPRGSHLHLGSFPVFLSSAPAELDALLQSVRDHSSLSLDPNVRPELMGDPHRSRERLESVLGFVDVVKASDEDIAWLYDGADAESVARGWLEAGPGLAVVTMGANGCFAVSQHGTCRVPPVRVDVVDTVGAGDTLMAALIDGLMDARTLGPRSSHRLAGLDADELRKVLARAGRAAAINVSRAGANPPSKEELDG